MHSLVQTLIHDQSFLNWNTWGVYPPLCHILSLDHIHIHYGDILAICLFQHHHAHHPFVLPIPIMHHMYYLALVGVSDNYWHHAPWIYRAHRMECGSLFGTSSKLGNGVAHFPIVYISRTIPSVQMEMDLVCSSPHNLKLQGIHLCDSPS